MHVIFKYILPSKGGESSESLLRFTAWSRETDNATNKRRNKKRGPSGDGIAFCSGRGDLGVCLMSG